MLRKTQKSAENLNGEQREGGSENTETGPLHPSLSERLTLRSGQNISNLSSENASGFKSDQVGFVLEN